MSVIERFYVATPDGQLHGRELRPAGNANRPPLVCLHPAPSSGLYFTTVMPLLNEHRQVVAPDYPGYGGSDALAEPPVIAGYARAMLQLLDARGTEQPLDLLGFHTGCLVAAEMALTRSESIRRLVLCDIPYFTGEAQLSLRSKMAVPMPVDENLQSIAAPWKFNIGSRLGSVPMPRAFELFAEHLRAGKNEYFGFDAAFSYDCEAAFGRLETDTVVLATNSGLLDATHAAAEVIPGAKLVDVAEVDTAVFEAGAEPIAKRILAALDG